MTRLAFVLALALVVVAGAAGLASYDGLPDPMPTHWNGHGVPDSYSPKGFFSVFGPVLVMLGLWLLMLAIAAITSRVLASAAERPGPQDSRRSLDDGNTTDQRRRQAGLTAEFLGWMALVVNAFITLLLLAIWWSPRNSPNPWFLWGGLVLMLAAVALLMLRMIRQGAREGALTAVPKDQERYYQAGVFYMNRDDPRITVPKRLGVGITFNFGHPIAWVFLAVLLLVPLTVVLLAALAG